MLVEDNPSWYHRWGAYADALPCLSVHRDDARACFRTALSARTETQVRVKAMLRAVAAEVQGAVVLKTERFFCSQSGWCPPIVGNMRVLLDGNHVAFAYSAFIADAVRTTLEQLLMLG